MPRSIYFILLPLVSISVTFTQTYSLWNKVLDDGGTVATSSSYNLKASFGQSSIGIISNSSYTAFIGFFGVYAGWHPPGIEEERHIAGVTFTFFLAPNYPNPFHSSTKIKYGLAQSCDVSLKIYNVNGQCVRTLVNSTQNAGIYEINWNGEDNSARRLPQGVYFLRMQAADYTATKKTVLLHR